MIAVGKIRKSVGLKGEVKVAPLGSGPERFMKLSAVWLGPHESELLEYAVQSVRAQGSDAVLKIKGVESRSDSDALRGHLVFVEEDHAITPSEGSYFVHDIIGLQVIAEDGSAIGPVTDVLTLPAGDVWSVQYKEKEVLIPAVKEYVLSVDLAKRTIVIRAIEGLLE